MANTEILAGAAAPATARRLHLDILNKRKFLAMLEGRLVVLGSELAAHEREEEELLQKLLTP
ncbi:Hypothetical protein MLTONO_p0563 (plasmid) [Mesorhizobium loti]|nr:Hypothetical protein MLTONO_p0563 [Mesorhizobium loti]